MYDIIMRLMRNILYNRRIINFTNGLRDFTKLEIDSAYKK